MRSEEPGMADDDHDFCDLRAVFVSCTLMGSPEVSDTEGLITNSAAIMAAHGVRTDTVRGGPRHGPSYLDEGSGGRENEFTQRNTTFLTWNLMHLAAMLKRSGGFPAHGNQRSAWDAGARVDHPNAEYG
jgi:hypothetical protein